MSAPLSLMTSCGWIDVAERLRHLPAVDVDQEPVRQDLPERRTAARAEPDQQRALEPAAMLIAALEIHVGRPRQLRAKRQDRFVARSGVEPDVEDVHLALERRAAARRAGQPVGHELLDRPLVPRVGAVRVEHRRRLLDQRRRQDAPRRTSCSRPPGSARPRRAGARCTSRAGSRPCCRCGRGPTPGSISPRGRSRRAPPARSVRRRRPARHRCAVHR